MMSSRDLDTRVMELGLNYQPQASRLPPQQRKPRLLILGHARHGKDTFAEIIRDLMDLDFQSSSVFVGERSVWPSWGEERYETFDECFADRVNYRSTWGNLIDAYTTPDKARVAREMFADGNDIYVGLRRQAEFNACMNENMFDHVIWVDRSDHLPDEPADSMEMMASNADIIVDNNGPESALMTAAVNLQDRLHAEGFLVNWREDNVFVDEEEPTFSSTRKVQSNVLIHQPTVFPMGQTQMDPEALVRWSEFNGLEDHLNNMDTPLGRMWADMDDEDSIARMIEFGGRHCYRAWEKGRSRGDYITNIIEMEHGSVLEHATINWAIQGVSRSLSLELARHRVGIALSQESQRYVDASEINFVVPPIVSFLFPEDSSTMQMFLKNNMYALAEYRELQESIVARLEDRVAIGDIKADTMAKKRANEAARALLPNDTETRFLWTTNMRLLLHFLWLRGGMGADLEIRRLAVELLRHAQFIAPEIFNSMTTKMVDGCYGVPIIVSAHTPKAEDYVEYKTLEEHNAQPGDVFIHEARQGHNYGEIEFSHYPEKGGATAKLLKSGEISGVGTGTLWRLLRRA